MAELRQIHAVLAVRDHPGWSEGIAISYRSFPVAPKHRWSEEGKKQSNFRKETREIDSRTRFAYGRELYDSEARGKVTTTRGKRPEVERIGKVEIARAKLPTRNGLPWNFRRRRCRGLLDFIGTESNRRGFVIMVAMTAEKILVISKTLVFDRFRDASKCLEWLARNLSWLESLLVIKYLRNLVEFFNTCDSPRFFCLILFILFILFIMFICHMQIYIPSSEIMA